LDIYMTGMGEHNLCCSSCKQWELLSNALATYCKGFKSSMPTKEEFQTLAERDERLLRILLVLVQVWETYGNPLDSNQSAEGSGGSIGGSLVYPHQPHARVGQK
jgi:hypothetical protein